MSPPLVHAERSARRWGGTPADYLPLHAWFDATKGHLPDVRHRLLLHNSFGMLLAEQVFGPALTNTDAQRVCIRDLAQQHILEDLGFVPTVADCFATTPCLPWMAGARRLLSHSPATLPQPGQPDLLPAAAVAALLPESPS